MSGTRAYLLVRSEVSPALRDQFDEWYETRHLSDARVRLGAVQAWRYWSDGESTVHYALYEFDGVAEVRERLASDAGAWLIADFDASWPDGVTRTRDVVRLVQELPTPS